MDGGDNGMPHSPALRIDPCLLMNKRLLLAPQSRPKPY